MPAGFSVKTCGNPVRTIRLLLSLQHYKSGRRNRTKPSSKKVKTLLQSRLHESWHLAPLNQNDAAISLSAKKLQKRWLNNYSTACFSLLLEIFSVWTLTRTSQMKILGKCTSMHIVVQLTSSSVGNNHRIWRWSPRSRSALLCHAVESDVNGRWSIS